MNKSNRDMDNENKENVNHPAHYNVVPGIECIDVVRHFNFVLGNAIKYLWRAGNKTTSTKLEDLQKAKWYIEFAIKEEEKRESHNTMGEYDGAV